MGDQVLAAASLAQRPPQFQSGDMHAIGTWCERQSRRPMPVVELPQLAPFGARFDRLAGAEVVTVAYLTDAGAHVGVSWLDRASSGSADTWFGIARQLERSVDLLVTEPSAAARDGEAHSSSLAMRRPRSCGRLRASSRQPAAADAGRKRPTGPNPLRLRDLDIARASTGDLINDMVSVSRGERPSHGARWPS